MGVCFRIYWKEQENICFEFSLKGKQVRDLLNNLLIDNFNELFWFGSCGLEREEEVQKVWAFLRQQIDDGFSFLNNPSKITMRKFYE